MKDTEFKPNKLPGKRKVRINGKTILSLSRHLIDI